MPSVVSKDGVYWTPSRLNKNTSSPGLITHSYAPSGGQGGGARGEGPNQQRRGSHNRGPRFSVYTTVHARFPALSSQQVSFRRVVRAGELVGRVQINKDAALTIGGRVFHECPLCASPVPGQNVTREIERPTDQYPPGGCRAVMRRR